MKPRKSKTTPKKDAITTRRNHRHQSESDILHQVRNEVQDALLHHAPLNWPDERLDQIEKQVLDHTRLVLGALSTNEPQSPGAPRTHTMQAVAKTRSLIQSWQSSLNKWEFPDDPELTTLPIILTLDNEDWATIDATIQRFHPDLKDREHFVEKAVGYALDSLEEEAAAAMAGLEEER